MRTLLFQNNVHSTEKVEIPGDEPRAINLTVRKGLKWADVQAGDIIEVREAGALSEQGRLASVPPPKGREVYATIYDVKVMSFADLMNYPRMLKLEHDPECQAYKGLFETMRKVYDGFLQHELVTLVMYELTEPKTCPQGCKMQECNCPKEPT